MRRARAGPTGARSAGLLDALERPEIRRGAVVRKADVDAGVAQVAAGHELEVVDVRKAAVALALGLEEAGVHAREVGVRRRQAVLPAVVGDVRRGRAEPAVVAERDRVLDGQRGGDVGGAEVDVVAVAVVFEAVLYGARRDAPEVGGVVSQRLVVAAAGLEPIAVAGAQRSALQLA